METKTQEFIVYIDQNNNMYVVEPLAFINNISNKGNTVIIKNEKYIQVNEDDIKTIIDKSNNTRKPIYDKCRLVDKTISDPLIKTTHQTTFNVYTDQNNNMYILEPLAFANKITNKGKMVMIKNEKYMQVNKEDIEEIMRKTNNDRLPIYKKCNLVDKTIDNPLIKPIHQASFFVYKDQHDNLYVAKAFAHQYGINEGKEIKINNTIYIQINENDIKDIIEKSNYSRIPEYKRCNLKESKDNNIINHNYFTYYEDLDNNTIYISKDINDLCKINGIKTSDKTKTIKNNEYYSISKDDLNTFMKKTGYIGQKQKAVLKDKQVMTINIYKIGDDAYIPVGLYSKYNSIENKETTTLDGVKYVKVTEDEVIETKNTYKNDGIKAIVNITYIIKNDDIPKSENISQNEEVKIEAKENDELQETIKPYKDRLDEATKEYKEKTIESFEVAKELQKNLEKHGIKSEEYKQVKIKYEKAEKDRKNAETIKNMAEEEYNMVVGTKEETTKKEEEKNTKLEELKEMLNKNQLMLPEPEKEETLMLPESIKK